MTAVYKKEMRQYFTGMLGYVFIAFILILFGIFTAIYNLQGYPQFEAIFPTLSVILLIAVPVLTMNVIAGEKRQHTDHLLLTSPVSLTKIMIGKYLAMLTVYFIPMAVVSLYPLILSSFGALNMGTIYGTITGFFFLGAALISIGMFVSCLTDSQILAAVISLGIFLLLYLMTNIIGIVSTSSFASLVSFTVVALIISAVVWFMTKNTVFAVMVGVVCEIFLLAVYSINAKLLEGAFTSVLSYLAIFNPISDLTYGTFSIATLVYYFSIVFLFIFLSIQALEKKRWS
ncbi:MAG: ABC transporter permease [Christensenellales bacterium]